MPRQRPRGAFEDEATRETEALLDRLREGEPAIAPAHWPTEVMNGLIVAVRCGRIDLERATRFARDLAALPIRIEPPHAPATWDAVIRVATEHHLTVYAAAYLELAERIGLPHASLDGDLRDAALAAGVALLATRAPLSALRGKINWISQCCVELSG